MQQALGKEALSDADFVQVFPKLQSLSFPDFVAIYENCRIGELLEIVSHLGMGMFQALTLAFVLSFSWGVLGSLGSLNDYLRGTMSINFSFHESSLKMIDTLLSPLRWGDRSWKRYVFLSRCTKDLSYSSVFSSIDKCLRYFQLSTSSLDFLMDPMFITNRLHWLMELVRPKHTEHERDTTCHRLFCSIQEEIAKPFQQLEFDDQRYNLPIGTSAKRVEMLTTALQAGTLFRDCVRGFESVEICSNSTRIVCEFDDLSLSFLKDALG